MKRCGAWPYNTVRASEREPRVYALLFSGPVPDGPADGFERRVAAMDRAARGSAVLVQSLGDFTDLSNPSRTFDVDILTLARRSASPCTERLRALPRGRDPRCYRRGRGARHSRREEGPVRHAIWIAPPMGASPRARSPAARGTPRRAGRPTADTSRSPVPRKGRPAAARRSST